MDNEIEITSDDQPKKGKKRFKIMKVSVTSKEIDDAIRCKTNKCMIHEAIKRDHPNFKRIHVDKNQVRFTDTATNLIYTFPMSAFGRTMMLLWDDGTKVNPFPLWLRNPIVREKVNIGGVLRPKNSNAKKHLGPIPKALTKEQSRQRGGRDRIFGQKLWTDELAKLRDVLNLAPVG
jgi:hypothetical protein